MSTLPGVLAIVALLLVNAGFVAAEFSLVAVDRARVEAAAEAGIKFSERPFSVDEALEAKEAFATGSNAHVKAVTSINGQSIGNGYVGELTSRLLDLYVDFIEDMGGPQNTSAWN